ncbi:MAG: hypothetical protein J5789_04715 [Oscillospiraceae bacterium]|nr:hypothetical protein [Oscillospiraceae bacterium]
MKRLCLTIVLALLMVLSACSEIDTSDSVPETDAEQPGSFELTNTFEPNLTVTITPWTGWTPEQPEPTTNTFEGITEGTVVYSHQFFGKITVSNVNHSTIELKIEGSTFAESNGIGTINLTGQTLEKLSIPHGEEVVIASKTMDAGVKLTIRYE